METLHELFEETLRDIYYAEKHILKALPKMAKGASSTELQAAFEEHYVQTEHQVSRLEQVFGILGRPARAKKCPAIDGIIEEGNEILKEAEDDTVRDAGLLAAAQAVEHYEISRYGTLKAWAEKLELPEIAALLEETLEWFQILVEPLGAAALRAHTCLGRRVVAGHAAPSLAALAAAAAPRPLHDHLEHVLAHGARLLAANCGNGNRVARFAGG